MGSYGRDARTTDQDGWFDTMRSIELLKFLQCDFAKSSVIMKRDKARGFVGSPFQDRASLPDDGGIA